MSPENFVAKVQLVIIQQNAVADKELFESTPIETVSDAYWKRALTLHQSLSDTNRLVLLEIIRQTRIDTISEIFGIIDGSSTLEGPREDFVLISQLDNRKLNGNLQDIFLELEEKHSANRASEIDREH